MKEFVATADNAKKIGTNAVGIVTCTAKTVWYTVKTPYCFAKDCITLGKHIKANIDHKKTKADDTVSIAPDGSNSEECKTN